VRAQLRALALRELVVLSAGLNAILLVLEPLIDRRLLRRRRGGRLCGCRRRDKTQSKTRRQNSERHRLLLRAAWELVRPSEGLDRPPAERSNPRAILRDRRT